MGGLLDGALRYRRSGSAAFAARPDRYPRAVRHRAASEPDAAADDAAILLDLIPEGIFDKSSTYECNQPLPMLPEYEYKFIHPLDSCVPHDFLGDRHVSPSGRHVSPSGDTCLTTGDTYLQKYIPQGFPNPQVPQVYPMNFPSMACLLKEA